MNYEFLELTELRKLLDTKQVTSVELTRYFLERAKRLNPQLNAYLTICEDHALAQARAADARLASLLATNHSLPTTNSIPPLLGIPYAAKDLFCTKGIRTTASSKILDEYLPPFDATTIKILNEQGAVLIGKTNLDEFAHGSSTETSAYGPSRNPWDTGTDWQANFSPRCSACSAGDARHDEKTDDDSSALRSNDVRSSEQATTRGEQSKILDHFVAPPQSAAVGTPASSAPRAQGFLTCSRCKVSFPVSPGRIPGGSSGGSSSAVGAGIAPWALATETGGSIRQPASLCGISGWKPTYGRVSRFGVISMGSSLDSIGTMALSVRDLAITADVLSGKDSYDSTTGNAPAGEYVKNLNADLSGVRIGVPKEYFPEGMDPEVKSAVKNAIEELKKRGATIVDVSLPNTKFGSLVYAIICPSEVSSNLARYDGIRYGHSSKQANNLLEVYTKSRGEGFGIEAQRRILTGTYVLSHGYYDAYYKKAQKVRGLLIQEFNDVFAQVDVLACPSVPMVAQKIGTAKANPLFGYIADQLNIPASMAGLPALSIPCGFALPKDSDATRSTLHATPIPMPVGLQIIGPQWGEQKIFNVGYAFQQATDWHKKHPGGWGVN